MSSRGVDATANAGLLRARFAIEPHPAAGCTIVAAGERGEDVSQEILFRGGECDCGTECRSAVRDPDSGERQYLRGTVNDRCICPVFRSHDCIASIEGFEGGVLYVSITSPSRDELSSLVSDLRATGATVRLERIARLDDELDPQPLELEVESLTDKQREAVFLAVEMGYYETPRRADLGDLATELDISRSAVSQRLTAVEAKLVTNLFEQS